MGEASILFIFNNFLYQHMMFPASAWAAYEMLISVPVFFFSVWQRVHSAMASTVLKEHSYLGVTLSQISLYMHMMLALICCADGYQLYTSPGIVPHVTTVLFLTSLFLRKWGIYLTYDKFIRHVSF